ncbi:MAG: hypothetical protein IAE81_19310 [Caldilineaceae bacterium]|nr:hypothetical protein [Caldilineaceae bacterium]
MARHWPGWGRPGQRACIPCSAGPIASAEDPAAEKLLAQALDLLDSLVQQITDADYRRTFLHAIPAYRLLRTANFKAKGW